MACGLWLVVMTHHRATRPCLSSVSRLFFRFLAFSSLWVPFCCCLLARRTGDRPAHRRMHNEVGAPHVHMLHIRHMCIAGFDLCDLSKLLILKTIRV